MSNKILSIIIPSYNMEAYLPKCLGSLIIDDYDLMQKLDVIVVNDGSKDRTSEIAHEFETKYPSVVHVIDKANGHYGSCINVGLASARGFFIKVLDADDCLDTVSLEWTLQNLDIYVQNNEPVDLVLTDIDQIDEQGKITQEIRYSFPTHRTFCLDEVLKNCKMLSMHGMIYRTSLLLGMDYHQTEGMLYTDGEWVSIPISQVRAVRFLRCSLYKYLVGREGQSVAQYPKNVWMLEHLLKIVCSYYARTEIADDAAIREYAHRFICMTARKIYVIWLLKKAILGANQGLNKFDAEFKEMCRECYDSISFSIFTQFYGGVDFIARWRKHRHLTVLDFTLLRFYVWLHDTCK